VLDAESLRPAVAGCRFIVHAAGYFRFWGNEQDFDVTNVGGTERLLNAALGSSVERIVHVSTVAVIGNPSPDQIVDETHPACPADAYQRSKLRAETLALQYHHEFQLPVIVLRPGAFYGPLGQYAFNRLFFKDPMRGIIMQVDGGRYVIFPVYIGDVAKSILQALTAGRVGEIYNICGESIPHHEAFDIVCKEAGLHWPRLPIPGWLGVSVSRWMTVISNITQREPFWPINLRSYVYNYWRVSSDKARRELNFAPTDFREGARRTIAWYRAGQPDHFPEVQC
jgi:nucleoside-diphosphate-sugar epimerase